MKRQKRKNRPHDPKSRVEAAAVKAENASPGRRKFLLNMRKYTIAGAVVGSAGWFAVDDVCATMRENDLSQIGNGTPSVVQIHDPNCNLCLSLQREARDAMGDFKEDQLQFIVANIISEKGQQLAASHGVGHVTLLLFDGAGKRRNTLVGPNTSEYLKDVFQQHLNRYGNAK